MNNERIIKHAVRCVHCGAEVESRHRDDLKVHSCEEMRLTRGPGGRLVVDGGKNYRRRIGRVNDFAEASLIEQK